MVGKTFNKETRGLKKNNGSLWRKRMKVVFLSAKIQKFLYNVRRMKKILLSFTVIILFTFYSWHEQQQANEVHVVIPKSDPSVTPADTATPIPTTGGSASISPTNGPVTTIPLPTKSTGQYKDGAYTGNATDAFYGTMQVKAIISGGSITDVQFLQYPNDRQTSILINQQAMPALKQEAIQAQNANVDIVSGATDSSQAFVQSLRSALAQAKS
jgi:uncharacterized protein with FMN-binding domain